MFAKAVTIKTEEKINLLLLTNNQKLKTLLKTMSTTLVIQHMKTTAMLLLDHPTS